jgi:prepilin-type processing-associated H-X9-DG protein
MYDGLVAGKIQPYDGDNGRSQRPISIFLCPSDSETGGWSEDGYEHGNIKNSYVGSLADLPTFVTGSSMAHHPRSWLEAGTRSRNFGSITDGSSNTVMNSERLINDAIVATDRGGDYRRRTARVNGGGYWNAPNDCLALKGPNHQYLNPNLTVCYSWHSQGMRAFDNMLPITAFHPVMPPNSPSCNYSGNFNEGIVSASSNHPGGVNASFLDGSIHFISETISTANLNSKADDVSNVIARNYDAKGGLTAPVLHNGWGLWAALGSINGDETVSLP